MKYKQYFTALLAGTMVSASYPVNSFANDELQNYIENTEIQYNDVQEQEDNEENDETKEIITEQIIENNSEINSEIKESDSNESSTEENDENEILKETNTEMDTEVSSVLLTEIKDTEEVDNNTSNFQDIDKYENKVVTLNTTYIEDGEYTADINILNENTDQESMASRYFTTTEVPMKAESGKVSVKLQYSTDMLEEISQYNGTDYTSLEIKEENEIKYVTVILENVAKEEKIQLKINANSTEMVHIVRLKLDKTSIKKHEDTNIPEKTLEDGEYTADIKVLNENTDQESMASRYFTTTEVPMKAESGKVSVKLQYSTDMLEEISQYNGTDYTSLKIKEENEIKYVTVILENVGKEEKIQLKINANGTEMVHIVRLKLDETSIKKIEDTNTPESADIVYSVPVKMVQSANSSLESMGNGAIDGNAVVSIKDGKSVIDIEFKAVVYAGLYGHVLNLWSYPAADNMNYNWWNNPDYEIPAETIEYYSDYGMEYTQGNTEKLEFIKTLRIIRDTDKEKSIYIRISVDAMLGYDQAARLDFDWDNAEIIENQDESIVSAPVITPTKTNAGNKEKISVSMSCATNDAIIYYTTNSEIPNENSQIYTNPITVSAPSVYGGDVVIKAVAVKDGMIDSSVIESIVSFDSLKKEIVASNETLSAEIEAVEGSIKEDNTVTIEYVSPDNEVINSVLNEVINKAQNIKAMNIDFALNENTDPLLLKINTPGFNNDSIKLYRLKTSSDTDGYENINISINDNLITAEITKPGLYVLMDEKKSSSNGSGSSSEINDGKYWIEINLWNANIDQESMGNSAFENNRNALVTISDGIARIEVATNPVSVSGYTSALKDIQSSEVSISKDSSNKFTTNTKYDGQTHSFDYVTKFSFNLNELNKEYINVDISVPYTPMDGVTQNEGGWISARLKLNWSNMESANSNATLNPSSATASGSSGSSGETVNFTSGTTGIKIEADEFVFDNGTVFETKEIENGNSYESAIEILGEDYTNFKLYTITATYNNSEIQPSGVVNVYFPVDESYTSNVEIYRITEGSNTNEKSKTLVEHKLSTDKKYYVITVKELGLFAVVNAIDDLEDEFIEKDNILLEYNKFNDIENHWAEENILCAVKFGLFKGIESNKFAPDLTSTREMFIEVLGRLDGNKNYTNKNSSFKDVNKSDYFYDSVMWALENGIVSGIDENSFGTGMNITREQMAVMLNKFVQNKGITLNKIYSVSFSDSESISFWAKDSVDALAEAGIISGRTDGKFDPKGTATRAEIATMLVKFIDNYIPEKSKELEITDKVESLEEEENIEI